LIFWEKVLDYIGLDPLVVLDPHMIARVPIGGAIPLNNCGSCGPTLVEEFAEKRLDKDGLIGQFVKFDS
jgi:hypothetical protein